MTTETLNRISLLGLCLALDVPFSTIMPEFGPFNLDDCKRCKWRWGSQYLGERQADEVGHCYMFKEPLDFRCIKGLNSQEAVSDAQP